MRRKITETIIQDFCIRDYNHENIGECIAIPVFDENGDFLFNKFRRSPLDERKPKYLYQAGGKISLYGWHKAKDYKAILITEGEIDCLVSWSANIPAITSTGGALSFQNEWGELLKDKEVTLCFDSDSAGGEGMVKALAIVPHAKILFLPKGVKDISDFVAMGGDLNALIKKTQRFTSYEDIQADRADRLAIFQDVFFHEAFIDKYFSSLKPQRSEVDRKKTTDKVMRAKSYPIPDLLDFKQNKAICPFHNEKTPSLNYYPQDNHTYCFGSCGRPYDSIAIYMKLNNCSFKEAIEKLQ